MVGRLFKTKTVEQQTETLASFLPGGKPFLAKRLPQTTLYKLLYGLAVETARAEGLLNDLTYEHEIGQTSLLISRWEAALGIPDDCFSIEGSLEQRRKNVLLKLGGLGLQTEADFIDLAAVFGMQITIEKGAAYSFFPFNTLFPIEFVDCPATARFTWRIRLSSVTPACIFPFNNLFPVCFSDGFGTIVECFFNKLKPANTDLIFILS